MSKSVPDTFSDLFKKIKKWSTLTDEQRVETTVKLAMQPHGPAAARVLLKATEELECEASDDTTRAVKTKVEEYLSKKSKSTDNDGDENNEENNDEEEGEQEKDKEGDQTALTEDEIALSVSFLELLVDDESLAEHAERSVGQLWRQCQQVTRRNAWLNYNQQDLSKLHEEAMTAAVDAKKVYEDKHHELLLSMYCQLVLATYLKSIHKGICSCLTC